MKSLLVNYIIPAILALILIQVALHNYVLDKENESKEAEVSYAFARATKAMQGAGEEIRRCYIVMLAQEQELEYLRKRNCQSAPTESYMIPDLDEHNENHLGN